MKALARSLSVLCFAFCLQLPGAALAQQADLSIVNTPSATTIGPGGPITYTITATNEGPSAAQPVITDVLASKTYLVSCVATGGGVCKGAPQNSVVATFPSLAAGASVTLTVQVTSSNTYGDYNEIVNTASVVSSVADPVAANNMAVATTTVRETADLSVSATLAGTAEGQLHYVATVKNLGPNLSHATLLTYYLPANTVFVSATTSFGACASTPPVGGGGRLLCVLGDVPHQTTATVNVVIQAYSDTCASASSTFTLSGKSIDPNAANDSSTVTTQLNGQCPGRPSPQYVLYPITGHTPVAYDPSINETFYGDDIPFGQNNRDEMFNNQSGTFYANGIVDPFPFVYLSNLYYSGDSAYGTDFVVDSINDAGLLSGYDTSTYFQTPATYSNGVVTDVPLNTSIFYENPGIQDPYNIGYYNSQAIAINNQGAIAGYAISLNSDMTDGFLYANGVTTDIGPGFIPTAMNNKNEIVGNTGGASRCGFDCVADLGYGDPALFYTHGIVTNLSLAPLPITSPTGIDSSSRIAASVEGTNNKTYAAIYGGTGKILYEDPSPGTATGINDCGEIVGSDANGPFLYSKGSLTSLTSLLPANLGYISMAPTGINNHGQIIGQMYLTPTSYDPVGFVMKRVVPESCGSDVSISSAPESPTVQKGDLVYYQVLVKNIDSPTTAFTVTDAFPGQTHANGCGVTGTTGWLCTVNADQTLTVSLPNLAKGTTATITVTIGVSGYNASNTVIVNAATVSSSSTPDYIATSYVTVQ